MPDWLSDPSPTFYILALVIALVAVGLWVHKRDRPNLVRAAAVVGLVMLVFLIDLAVESPREESVRKVGEITAAVNDRNPDQLAANVSDSFEYKGINKSALKTAAAWNLVRQHDVRVAAWDFSREEVERPSDKEIVIGFLAKGEAAGREVPAYIRATFVEDPDGQWRLKTFKRYDDPLKRAKGSEANLPGLP